VRDVLVGGDVSDEDDVVRMVGKAAEALGGLDILVNNAGIQISRPSHELSSADFDRVLEVGEGLFGRVAPPAGPVIERYGSANPWPWDRYPAV